MEKAGLWHIYVLSYWNEKEILIKECHSFESESIEDRINEIKLV